MKFKEKREKRGRISALALISLMLISVMILIAGCSNPAGGGGGSLDTAALEAKIDEANNERTVTTPANNGSAVPLGTFWVEQDELDLFDAAIAAALSAKSNSTTQAQIDAALTVLEGAINRLKHHRQPGEAAPVDKIALIDKIAEAEGAKLMVIEASNGSQVASGMYWVSQQAMAALNTAIAAANTVRNNSSATQASVDTAVTVLNNAINTFNSLRQQGSKTSGFTASELGQLITRANNSKDGVIVSTDNGNDVRPGVFWVSNTLLTALNTAISSAEANAGNIDAVYMSLVTAMSNFNEGKQLGVTPDRDSLYYAIRNADSAKKDVFTASDKTQAPEGYHWATEAQWAAFNTVYNAALSLYSNMNATKNQVDQQIGALNTAKDNFIKAVEANGPGEPIINSITITGLEDYNGHEIGVGLFTSVENIDLTVLPDVFGGGVISGGRVTIKLYTDAGGWTSGWAGDGSWYMGIEIFTDGLPVVRISSSPINFTSNRNPSIGFGSFIKYAFETTWGELLEDYNYDFPVEGILLNDLAKLILGNQTATYADAVRELGIELYKDKTMTQPFTGGDRVYVDTKVYSETPLSGSDGGEPEPEPIDINYTVEAADGGLGSATTELILYFDRPVSRDSINSIYVYYEDTKKDVAVKSFGPVNGGGTWKVAINPDHTTDGYLRVEVYGDEYDFNMNSPSVYIYGGAEGAGGNPVELEDADTDYDGSISLAAASYWYWLDASAGTKYSISLTVKGSAVMQLSGFGGTIDNPLFESDGSSKTFTHTGMVYIRVTSPEPGDISFSISYDIED